MSSRNWVRELAPLLIIAIIIIAAIPMALLIDRHIRSEADERYAAQAYERCNYVSSPSSHHEATKEQAEACRDQWRDTEDLFAQREMARWTPWVFIIAFAELMITSVGVLYVAWTLRATKESMESDKQAAAAQLKEARRAAAEAKTAADSQLVEAAKATAEAVRIGEAQVRAYLTCVEGEYSGFAKSYYADIIVENTGNSPARNITVKASLYFAEDVDSPGRRVPYTRRINSISSRERRKCECSFDIYPEDSERSVDYDIALISLTVELLYTDVFRRRFRQTFDLWPRAEEGDFRRGTLSAWR